MIDVLWDRVAFDNVTDSLSWASLVDNVVINIDMVGGCRFVVWVGMV